MPAWLIAVLDRKFQTAINGIADQLQVVDDQSNSRRGRRRGNKFVSSESRTSASEGRGSRSATRPLWNMPGPTTLWIECLASVWRMVCISLLEAALNAGPLANQVRSVSGLAKSAKTTVASLRTAGAFVDGTLVSLVHVILEEIGRQPHGNRPRLRLRFLQLPQRHRQPIRRVDESLLKA